MVFDEVKFVRRAKRKQSTKIVLYEYASFRVSIINLKVLPYDYLYYKTVNYEINEPLKSYINTTFGDSNNE